jgi:hypothetical protein
VNRDVARDLHLQRRDQPALQLPVCGAAEYEATTSDPDAVTCLECLDIYLNHMEAK